MSISIQNSWITEHRSWEDIISALFGVLIVLSPTLAGAQIDTAVAISSGLAGVFITGLALLELMSLQRWEEVMELICGAWVAAAPFVLNYGGTLAASHYVLGGTVAALAVFELWQDRNRRFQS